MKQLTERDRARVLEYVGAEPEVNLFFIGDVENFGVDSPEVTIWVHGTDDVWDSVVLRYQDNYVIYSQNAGYDAGPATELLKSRGSGLISGKYEIVARLEGYFPRRQLRRMYLAKCTSVKTRFATPADITLRMLTPDDAEAVVDLMLRREEFQQYHPNRDISVKKLRTGLSRGGAACGAFLDGALVSCAQTTAENSKSAMVVGVATREDVQRRGYASAVVSALCERTFERGKEFLCLFYDNPAAGRIYNRVGFEPFGEYALFK